tara:strand:- start:536 stop:844 length:309 start_codon:yes stop_codon:yes gene_type:complete
MVKTKKKIKKKAVKKKSANSKGKRFASRSIWAKIRAELDLTQTQMAEKISVTQPWLWRVEAELSVPSILFVTRACKELNVDIRKIERYYRRREKYFKGDLLR